MNRVLKGILLPISSAVKRNPITNVDLDLLQSLCKSDHTSKLGLLYGKDFSTSSKFEKRSSDYYRYGTVRSQGEDFLKPQKEDRADNDLTSLIKPSNPNLALKFPTRETHDHIINGIRFSDIPIVHITATSNNTKLSLNRADGGVCIALHTAGTCGFHHAKKGTNVAAQAAAIALAKDALRDHNIKTVRVCLRGIGPGRLPALTALQMTGLEVVSITDTTRLAHNGNRPKKARRL